MKGEWRMSNEELAVLVKDGDFEAAAELWKNCHKLIWRLMWRYLKNNAVSLERVGVELSDLEQACYLVMIDAAEAFSPEKDWRFNTILSWQLKNRFDKMCGRYKKKDALNESERLEAPIVPKNAKPKEDEAERQMFIEDPEATAAMQNIVERETRKEIVCDVRKAVRRLPEPGRTVVILKYYCGADYELIAKKTGKTAEHVRRICCHALSTLGKDRQIQNAARTMGII